MGVGVVVQVYVVEVYGFLVSCSCVVVWSAGVDVYCFSVVSRVSLLRCRLGLHVVLVGLMLVRC